MRLFPNEHCVHTSVVAARDERAPSRWLAPSSKKKEFAGDADTAVSMNEDAGVSHTPANPTFSVFHDPVLRAAAWYAGKVRGAFPVVVLSDDRASTLNGGVDQNANLASEMRRRLPPGVEVLAAHEYFPRFHSNDVDVMNAFESVREANEAAMKADEERKLLGLGEHGGGNRARAFAPHWDNDAIVGGLESGELMRGTIKVCRWRPEEATVRVGEDEERTDAATTTEMIILWKRSETFWYLPERCGTGHSTATAWPCVCCRGVGGCRRKGRTRWRKVTPTPTLTKKTIQTETKTRSRSRR